MLEDSDELATISEHVGGSDYYFNLLDHTYLKTHVKAKDARYLCVLYPRKLLVQTRGRPQVQREVARKIQASVNVGRLFH